jgi:CheY-like chemotaxis protein
MPDPLQILIVDDERLARRSLRSALNGVAGVAVAGEAASIDAAAEQIRTEAPDERASTCSTASRPPCRWYLSPPTTSTQFGPSR